MASSLKSGTKNLRVQQTAKTRQKPPTLRRFKPNFRWEETELEPYKVASGTVGDFRGASRQVLIGKRGEQVAFHVRYFELEPQGFTSLERHRHAHVVIAVRGRGFVRVGDQEYDVSPMDLVYIGPDEPHQLKASADESFGFFCIVNARRDKPRPIISRV